MTANTSQNHPILDTRAGPNVFKLEALPADVYIDAMPLDIDIRTASGSSLPTLYVTHVYVKIGT